MQEQCPACYAARVYCRKCKTAHCQCSWNRHQVELNPDFRKNPKTQRFCVRCQKDLNPTAQTVAVTVNWDTWMVRLGGNELLGVDCAKKIGLRQ